MRRNAIGGMRKPLRDRMNRAVRPLPYESPSRPFAADVALAKRPRPPPTAPRFNDATAPLPQRQATRRPAPLGAIVCGTRGQATPASFRLRLRRVASQAATHSIDAHDARAACRARVDPKPNGSAAEVRGPHRDRDARANAGSFTKASSLRRGRARDELGESAVLVARLDRPRVGEGARSDALSTRSSNPDRCRFTLLQTLRIAELFQKFWARISSERATTATENAREARRRALRRSGARAWPMRR